MKFLIKNSLCWCVVIALLLFTAAATSAQNPATPMTNAAVIKLVRAGFKDKTVIAIIHSRPNRFQLDPDRLIELKRNGVSENIILAMLSQGDPFFSDDDLSFSSHNSKNKPSGAEGEGDDIFGDSSGSNSETRGRGTSGGNEGDRTTTGNATVRILKPPPDASGAVKLERTPTLNNDSIIHLVDAGFSEGTIISRIEGSPVDFDLTDLKIDELRRHRVAESVINAMRAAMRDDASPSGPNSTRTRSN